VVDSVRLPFDGAVFVPLMASPSGRWLLAYALGSVPTDTTRAMVLNRAGEPTDTIPITPRDLLPVWDASRHDALLLDRPLTASGAPGASPYVLVRRPIDRQGRLGPPDTVATHDGSAAFRSISSDGTQLFFDLQTTGAITAWTATRPNTQSLFSLGRELISSADIVATPLSPRGGWILVIRRTGGAGNLVRIELEPFTGGERRTLEAAVPYQDIAFSPGDDSLAIATSDGPDRLVLTSLPLPSGSPVRHGSYPGRVTDLEWLSDGRLATPHPDGRSVTVFGKNGGTESFPFADSLGRIISAGRSPTAPELAILSAAQTPTGFALYLSRMEMTTGRVAPIIRLPALGNVGAVWWSTDGFLRFVLPNFLDRTTSLVRVPVTGGAIESDRPLTLAPGAVVGFLSHDGLRAIVTTQSVSSNVAVLRAPGRGN
jgi:hypothetical protein